MQITVTQLAMWSDVTRVVVRHLDHTNSAGVVCHGPDAADGLKSKHHYAAHLSTKTKAWFRHC